MKCWWVGLAIFSLLVSCTPKTNEVDESFAEVRVQELAEEIHVPQSAWDLIQGVSLEDSQTLTADKDGAGVKAAVSMMGVNVIMREKNPGIISDPKVRINFPQGGGSLDLARYVSKTNGTFFLQFSFPDKDFTPEKVIFVNRTIPRMKGSEKWGLPCHAVLDISTRFNTENPNKGLELNTSDLRYLNIIGGTFIFSQQVDKKLKITQVTFRDSRYDNLQCEIKK